MRASVVVFLGALLLCACAGADEKGAPDGGEAEGRILEPLPPAPRPAVDPEEMPGADEALAVVAARPRGAMGGDVRPTITFSRPVVALESIEAGERRPPPARIEPGVAGSWRWIGSSAVEFVPERQLPMATAFRVTVPAGLAALDGARLEESFEFGFSTPAPELQRIEPPPGHRWLPARPRFTVVFNQPVVDLAGNARLLVEGSQQPVALRVVEEVDLVEELRAHEGQRRHPRMEADPFRNQQRRYVLEAAAALPADREVMLVFNGDLRGAQGPLILGNDRRESYRTWGKMAVAGVQACLHQGSCSYGPLILRTTNPAVVADLRARLVVEPPVEIDWDRVEAHLPAAWTGLRDPHVALPGRWRPGTTYRITVRQGLADEFGQRAGAFEGSVRFDDRPPGFDAGGDVALLERDGDGALPIETVNLPDVEVTIWRLDPAEMVRALAHWGRKRTPRKAPARRLRLDTSATPNETRRTALDVREAIGGDGLFAVRVASDRLPDRGADLVLGQITDLAVHAKLGATSGLVWVTRLSTGASVPGAALALRDRTGAVRWRGRTDEEGLARLPGMAELVPGEDAAYRWDPPHALITAELDGELGATLSGWMGPLSPAAFDLPMAWDGAQRRSLGLVFSDRGIYRPGDEVHVKGVARYRRFGVLEKPPAGTAVQLILRGPRGDEVARSEAEIGAFGTFHATFVVPPDAPLGTFSLAATASLQQKETLHWGGTFRVEEYRAPHFQVDVGLAADELFAGDELRGSVLARYLFGGAMADARVRWSVARESIDFRPPGNEGFAFGSRTWWWDDGTPAPTREIAGGGEGHTDAAGALAIAAGRAEAPAGRTWAHILEAEVEDVDRQRVAARARAIVHPAAAYAGVRLARTGFAEAGEEARIELVAARPDGSRLEGSALALQVKRRTWQSIRKRGVGGHWYTESEPVEEAVARCEVRSEKAPVACAFTPAEPGFYILEATVEDEAGRTQTTRDAFYVVGSGWVAWQRNDTDRIDLVADRTTYAPGDTARILVKSPWPEAEALLTVERSGVISARRVKLVGAATTLEVPIDEEAIPNVFVGVQLVRGRVEEGGVESGADPGRPAVRVGYVELQVEEASRRLAVDVAPDAQEKGPGDRVHVRLQVRGHDGRGAPAELAVWAVDEAVLRLTGYEAPDLVEAMYPRQGLSVRIGEPLLHLVQRHLYGEKGETAGGGGGEGAGGGIRTDFRTTVLFAPAIETDEAGRAEVAFELPDNLTTFRILAVAVGKDERFGAGVSSVRVSRPLLALPALPRLARVGDRFEAGVVLHGHRFSAPEVEVRAEAEGLAIEGAATRTVAVVEGRPAEVRFPFVARQAGEATLRFFVEGGGARDGIEQKIPVQLPVAMEAVAAWGDTTSTAVEGLSPPAAARPDVGGLELSLASTALGGYDENFDQLVAYPWGCLEQEASRLVPFVALRELAGTFGVPWKEAQASWIAPEALQAAGGGDPDEVVRRTIAAIERLQNHDGGYRYWPSSPCSSHHGSAWAVWALARAKEVGYPVDEAALARGQAYLADVVAAGQCERCGWGCTPPQEATRVMALWTLARTGSPRPSYLPALYEKRARLPLFAQALLADAIFVGGGDRARARALLQEILNHAQESPAGVHFQERDPRTWAALWSSDTRTTAIVLGLLATITPDHPWVGKMARWLETARGGDGRWSSTQDAAWSLVSLVEVVRSKERDAPAFDAVVRLGGEPILERRFEGRSMEIVEAQLPMRALGAGGDLSFSREGQGVLYYGARLRYAPAEMPTTPLDRGFVVQRWFEPWEGGGQARRFFAGELVRVRVRVATSQERHYGIIEVPLPAGLEAVDASLASTAALPRRQGDEGVEPGYEWESAEDLHGDAPPEAFSPWASRFFSPFNHTELRDDRVILFADRLPPGVHTASFVARATTPGRFTLPPARAEEMYAPEVFGRSDGGALEVLAGEEMAAR